MSNLIYLAGPYSHENPDIRHERYKTITRAAGELISKGYIVFSPITHNHPIVKYTANVSRYGWFAWKKYDLTMLDKCDTLLVLKLEGWQESVGVKAEIEYAKSHGKDVLYISLDEVSEVQSFLSKHYTEEQLESL